MATDIELLSRKAGRQAALAEAGMLSLLPVSDLPGKIESVRLFPFLSHQELKEMCLQAKSDKFAAICVPLPWVDKALQLLSNSSVRVSTVVSFPLGVSPGEIKCEETQMARLAGAAEIKVALAIHKLKIGDKSGLRNEMEKIREAAGPSMLSFFIETTMLSDAEVITAVRSAEMARAEWVIGGSGFWGFTSIKETALLRSAAPDWMKVAVTVSPSCKGAKNILPLLAAGAERIMSEVPENILGLPSS